MFDCCFVCISVFEYFDFVKQRVSCIDLHKTKNYKYFIQDIIQKAGRPTYKILVSNQMFFEASQFWVKI